MRRNLLRPTNTNRVSMRAVVVTIATLALLPTMAIFVPAAADTIWHQSIGRASSEASCYTSTTSDLAAGWTNWAPSWEQWANNSKGGFVCNRQITWAYDSAPPSATDSVLSFLSLCRTTSGGSIPTPCALGTYGPGGGLIFLITSGGTYEMAPRNWGVNETTGIQWCSDLTNSVTTATVVGSGSTNTTTMLTSASPFSACALSSPNAAQAYNGGGLTDWFLPSKDELNAMCNYSRNPTTPATPTTPCTGFQNSPFANGPFGLANDIFWSSSQDTSTQAWYQAFSNGTQYSNLKGYPLRMRPVRTF